MGFLVVGGVCRVRGVEWSIDGWGAVAGRRVDIGCLPRRLYHRCICPSIYPCPKIVIIGSCMYGLGSGLFSITGVCMYVRPGSGGEATRVRGEELLA